MLKQYISDAINTLDELINITQNDIENIKEAKHSSIDESVKSKTSLVKKFENIKKELDKELVSISKLNDSKNLADILDDEVKSKLVIMREKLEILNKKNKEYAKHVVLVKDFFDSLTKELFNPQSTEYTQAVNVYKTRV